MTGTAVTDNPGQKSPDETDHRRVDRIEVSVAGCVFQSAVEEVADLDGRTVVVVCHILSLSMSPKNPEKTASRPFSMLDQPTDSGEDAFFDSAGKYVSDYFC